MSPCAHDWRVNPSLLLLTDPPQRIARCRRCPAVGWVDDLASLPDAEVIQLPVPASVELVGTGA